MFVLSIYRCPRGCFVTFLNVLQNILGRLGINRNIVLAGDFNVHFNTGQTEAVQLCDVLESHGFVQTITAPTRQQACLDNIFINFCKDSFLSDVVDLSVSDHLGQELELLLMRSQDRLLRERKVCRPLTQRGMLRFFNLVEASDWDFVSGDLDINTKFSRVLKLLEGAYYESFPEKIYVVRSDQGLNISWFDDHLRAMRSHLQLLGELSRQHDHARIKLEYKNYKLQYKTPLRKPKLDHVIALLSDLVTHQKPCGKSLTSIEDPVRSAIKNVI